MLELDPWEIMELLICKRGEQFVSVEFATDVEFDTWAKSEADRERIPINDNGITEWSFDDRCRFINHVFGQGGSLHFADELTLYGRDPVECSE